MKQWSKSVTGLAGAALLALGSAAGKAAPANDNFADRIALNGAVVTTSVNNNTATKEPGEPNLWSNAGGRSVWWTWTAVNTGPAIFSTAGSTQIDTIMAVFTGNVLTNLSLIASNDDFSGFNYSRFQINVMAGTAYQIGVDGFNGDGGNIVLNITNLNTAQGPVTFVASNATWRYLDTGVDQGTSWTNLTFNDTSWGTGPAELGFGDAGEGRPEATVISRTNTVTGTTNITFYFRRVFQATNVAQLTGLTVRVMRDDAAVVFLNGNEVFHDSNFPPGPVTYSTFATTSVPQVEEYTFLNSNVNPALLVEGTNILAVEVHQPNLTSSDVSFALELLGQFPTSNAPPAATLTGPAGGSTFAAPGPISLTATASDSDGSIARVEFYQNGNFIGQDTSNPYAITWSNVVANTYNLRAVAQDNGGARATSAVVSITVTGNVPPTASITSPANNASFLAPASITINAAASDLEGPVSSVEFYFGTTLLATDNASPFSHTENNVPVGTYDLRAVAIDAGGARGTSAVVNVNVISNTPPAVAIVNPTNDQAFIAPASITIEANATDLEGPVARVDFYSNGSPGPSDTTAPFTITVNNVTAGDYALTAVAVDAGGLTATSAVVNIRVTNAPAAMSQLVASNSVWRYLDDGSDQGTAWIAPGFNDASWSEGPAELGYGDGFEATTNSFGPDPNNKYITTYYRKRFVVNNPASYTGLVARVVRDDGVLVYLNGTEVIRSNMPAGPIAFNTTALAAIGGADESTFHASAIDPGLLVSGTNVLAVEIHQNITNSSDISFNLELVGLVPPASNAPPTATITTPANMASFMAPTTIVIEATASDPDGSVTVVEFTANGALLGSDSTGPFSYAWSGASPGSFALRAVAVDDLGRRGTSAPVTITVTGTANQPPTATWTGPAEGSTFTAPGIVTLSANAADSDGTVSRVDFYYRNGGSDVKIGEDTTSPYSLAWSNALVGNFAMTAVAVDNLGALGTSAPPVSLVFTGLGPVTLIPTGSVWKYLADGSDQGTAWRAPGFPDGSWFSGPAQLGYGDGDEATVVNCGPSFPACNANNFITTYFRHSFNVANPAAFSYLAVRLRRDDGAVVYINGVEVFRSNMAAGTVNYLTLAQNAGDDGGTFQSNSVPASALVAGENVVAVEVHQSGPNSSDISFELTLTGETGAIVNNPPTVSLTSPLNNSTFTEPANITLTAAASDPGGSITRVEFYVGTTRLGEDTTAPYNFVWSGVPLGNYALRAVATDNFGAAGTSAVVNVFVVAATAPMLAGQAPLAGASLSNLTQITVTFSEPVDGLNASDLLVNGRPATAVTGANDVYTFSFPQPLEGVVTVNFAQAHGIADRESPPKPFDATAPEASWTYTLTDTIPPTVTLIEPAPGATLREFDVVRITFSEPVRGLNASDLRLNGVGAIDLNGSGAGPYRFQFNQPGNGNPIALTLAWTNNHGITDLAVAANAFAGGSWSYTLDTNLVENVVINEIYFHPLDPRDPANPANGSEPVWREFIELLNVGANTVNLTGWRISRGVSFNFPSMTLAPGAYLVIAANTNAFATNHPGVTNYLGPWFGQLANTSEDIEIENARGDRVDLVTYADEGDWATRIQVPFGAFTGWRWSDDTDGGGRSLELRRFSLPNEHGGNWAPSAANHGTPGAANSVLTGNLPPLIVDAVHSPLVPKSTESVTVTARILNEITNSITARVFYRDASGNSPLPAFTVLSMLDNGTGGDAVSGDGVFSATLPAAPDLTIIEFYIEAVDGGDLTNTWPAPARLVGGALAQAANALYQVNDDPESLSAAPIYWVIMTNPERQTLADIDGRNDAEMNMTLIVQDGTGERVRYNTGLRHRGAGSRGSDPPNYRLNLSSDRPLNNVASFNLNRLYPHSQVAGSVFSRKSGLHSEELFPVQLRENGINRAPLDNVTHGHYVHIEAVGGDFPPNHFPNDPDGNAYRIGRIGSSLGGLSYQGADPNTYARNGYEKQSNLGENDWSDLVNLVNVINNTPDGAYPAAFRQVANADAWIKYLAVLALVGYGETSIGSNGDPDDYSMYRGVLDPRFLLLPHDHDTDFGQGDGSLRPPTDSVFRATANPAINRFLTNPEFTPLYFAELKRLCETIFSPAQSARLFEDSLLWWGVPASTVNDMKAWAVARCNNVLSQFPTSLTLNVPLPVVNGYFQTLSANVALDGQGDATTTRFVRVNGQFASWNHLSGTWSHTVNLRPGLNNVLVESLDAANEIVQSQNATIWYDDGGTQTMSGTVTSDTTWTAAGGPYFVSANVTVNTGVTLTIEPGTTLYFAQGVNLTVNGRLLAEGTESARIRFTRTPGTTVTWGGIRLVNGVAENRILHADVEFANTAPPVYVNNSSVLIDDVVFSGTANTVVDLVNASAHIRNSVFPSVAANETIHGNGMPATGYVIIEGNTFGSTTGYSDIIDFTGGQRPGPILQVYNNVFNGATDDVLDLDGTDAHIEGNVFRNVHQDGVRDSASHAVATDAGSEVTVVRNVFYDCDHALLLKNGSTAVFHHNTVVHIRTNALATNLAAVINFGEPQRNVGGGGGADLDGNIFWDIDSNRHFLHFTNGAMFLNVNRSLLGGTNHPGTGNLSLDPMFVDPMGDFHLLTGSPAIAAARNHQDMGAYVPQWVTISGEPVSPTALTSATLSVYGPGITDYRYRVNNGPWSAETPVASPIVLTSLVNGAYTVSVVGKNSAALSQAFADAALSRTWVVNTGLPAVILSEVLARNVAAVPVGMPVKYPDLIELHNPGGAPADISGWGITDELDNPFKFTFGPGTILGPGSNLVLFADNDATPAGIHVGFSLKGEGDEVLLFRGDGRLADAITFGVQLADFSVARLGGGDWGLAVPSFGAANVRARTGDETGLIINEWLTSGLSPYPYDFIELFNPDPLPVAVGELFLTDNPLGAPFRHDIAALSFIAGGGYGVFIADGDTGAGADHVNFRLASEQGMIGLVAADGTLLDCVIYEPQSTDVSMGRQPNGGVTFGRFNPPNPGAPNPGLTVPGTTPTINEVLAFNVNREDPDGTTPDWIEIYNPLATPADISDMSLSDVPGTPRKYVFAPGTMIPGFGHLIIRSDADKPAGPGNTGFGLDQNGAAVYLFDKLANGGGQLSGVTFGVQAADFSISRSPDGTTNWVCAVESLGFPNGGNVAVGPTTAIKVNEWLANPPSGDDDWFELYNPSPQPVALGGLWLSDNLATRQKHQIAPLSFLGIGAFGYQRFWADEDVAAGPNHVSFSLRASSEAVAVSSPSGVLLDGISWFVNQLEDVSEGRLPDGAAAPYQKFITTKSPGDANYLPLTNVVVNEVLTHSDNPLEDAIELRNLTGVTVDVGGWFLSDAKNTLKKYRIPFGTTLAPNGFKVFYEYQFNDVLSSNNAAFSLNSSKGDEVYLSAAGTNGALTGYRDTVEFGAGENGVSFGRHITSALNGNAVHFVAQSARTFGVDAPETTNEFRSGAGLPNAYPKVGPIVISEIMYHPLEVGGTNEILTEEYIELHNFTGADADLFHPQYPTNTWRLRGGVDFNFPQGVTLPNGGYLLVVSFNPADTNAAATFRAKYGLSSSVPLHGPWSGRLDNGGEAISLYKPDAPQLPPDPDAGFVPYILVERVDYEDAAPWPSCGPNCGADGGGQSLHRANADEYGNDPINWFASTPTPGPQGVTDTDGDGMPDAWENLYPGLNPLVNDANGDLDNDGASNLHEYLTCTIPNDANSVLRLRIVSTGPTVLQFTAAAGKSYRIEYTGDLNVTNWTALDTIPPGAAGQIDRMDNAPTNRFYRILFDP